MGNDVVVASTFPPARLTRIDNSVSVSSVTSKMLLSPVSSNSYPLVVRLVGGLSQSRVIFNLVWACTVLYLNLSITCQTKEDLLVKAKIIANSIYHPVDLMGADTVCLDSKLELVSVWGPPPPLGKVALVSLSPPTPFQPPSSPKPANSSPTVWPTPSFATPPVSITRLFRRNSGQRGSKRQRASASSSITRRIWIQNPVKMKAIWILWVWATKTKSNQLTQVPTIQWFGAYEYINHMKTQPHDMNTLHAKSNQTKQQIKLSIIFPLKYFAVSSRIWGKKPVKIKGNSIIHQV